ncbi:hypothetical protein [Brevibacillus sp. H7]|uniref:hypothetical protein n=1 Tax=Brevibacillus sp. H7 TaxID=3349138 RepID=UPI00382D58C4
MPDIMTRYRNTLFLSALVLFAFAIRFRFAGQYAESWDAVDFALALQRFDIFHMQPHFPGYPLYILTAHLFANGTTDPVQALTCLSVCFGSLSVIPFYSLAKRLLPDQQAVWIAVLLFVTSPLLGLAHVQPMSEALGLFAVLLYVSLLACSLNSKKPLVELSMGAILFAIVLGIRISYFPVGLLLLYPLARLYRQRSGLGPFLLQTVGAGCLFLLALAAWLLPTAATEGGLVPYWQLGKAFTAGHFTEWGGTSFSSEAAWWERLQTLVWDRLLVNGLIGASSLSDGIPLPVWLSASLLAAFLVLGWAGATDAFRRGEASVRWFLLLAVVPYALWVFFGQNSEKARHLLPLLPWLYLLLGRGWAYVRSKWRGPAGALVLHSLTVLLLVSLLVRQWTVLQQHLFPPPALQLVTYVQQHFPAEGTIIYTWEEQRLFDYYAPEYDTERLRSFDYFAQSLQLRAPSVSRVLVTNAVLDGFGPGVHLPANELARFNADPFLYPSYHTVVLYELSPQTIERIASGMLRP